MNVLVVPEDFRKDQYLLKPIVTALFASLGKERATVRVCQDPLLGGIGEALDWGRIRQVLERYRGMVDIFLVIVDRDGVQGRRAALDGLEEKAKGVLPGRRVFLAENAWQEVEVWVLAGLDLPHGWQWSEIRAEIHPKERFFEPVAQQRGVANQPAGGRKTLATEAAARFGRILQLCQEDVAVLKSRLQLALKAMG